MIKSIAKFLFFAFLITAAYPLFATPPGLAGVDRAANEILNFFRGGVVRTILGICFIASCIMFAYGKDNEKMKKAAISIGIAVIAIAGATEFINWIWSIAS